MIIRTRNGYDFFEVSSAMQKAIDFLKGSWTTDGGVEVYKKLISCYKDLQGFETAMKNNLYNYNRSRLKYGTTEAYEVHNNG